MRINAAFQQNVPNIQTMSCEISRAIELPAQEFDRFRMNLQRPYMFLEAMSHCMFAQGGTTHCLLVLGEGCDDGILVNARDGAVRQAAFLPSARQLAQAGHVPVLGGPERTVMIAELQFESAMREIPGVDENSIAPWIAYIQGLAGSDMREYYGLLGDFREAFCDINERFENAPAEIFNHRPAYLPNQLLPVADYIVNGGGAKDAYDMRGDGFFEPVNYAMGSVLRDRYNDDGGKTFTHEISVIRGDYGLTHSQMSLVLEKLRASGEVEALTADEASGELTIRFKPLELEQDAPEPLTQDDLNAMCARHILWRLNQPDGVRADFSGQRLEELDFERYLFRGASFIGADIRQCNMQDGVFDDCDFTGAVIRDTDADGSCFHNANFSQATLINCSFYAIGCDECKFNGARLEGCGFDDHALDADFSQAEIVDCAGLEHLSHGPTMTMGG